MTACPFCEIVTHDRLGQIIERIGDSIVIEPRCPVTPGHRLIITRSHVRDAAQDYGITAGAMGAAAKYASRLRQDCNIITSIGSLATQTIFHLHIHIVPRTPDDGLTLPWTP